MKQRAAAAETPRNPNYYLIINEFKAELGENREKISRLLSSNDKASCCDVELTFNVYIFYGWSENFHVKTLKITKKKKEKKTTFSCSNGIFMRPWKVAAAH